jgi:hypothetical protein
MKLTDVKPTVFESFDEQDSFSGDHSSHPSGLNLYWDLKRKEAAVQREIDQTEVEADVSAMRLSGTRRMGVIGNEFADANTQHMIDTKAYVLVGDTFAVVNIPKHQSEIQKTIALYDRCKKLKQARLQLSVRATVAKSTLGDKWRPYETN